MALDEQRLAEIEARCAVAPAGPWYAEQERSGWNICDGDRGKELGWLASCGHATGEEVATFCAHARTDVPDLVAEVRKLRAAILEWLDTASVGQAPLEYLGDLETHRGGALSMHVWRDEAHMIRLALGLDAPSDCLHNPSIPAREGPSIGGDGETTDGGGHHA